MNAVYVKTSVTKIQLYVRTTPGPIHVQAKVASCRAILIPICFMVSSITNSSLLSPPTLDVLAISGGLILVTPHVSDVMGVIVFALSVRLSV